MRRLRGYQRTVDFADQVLAITEAFLDRGFVELASEHNEGATYTFAAPGLIPRSGASLDEVVEPRRRIEFLFARGDLAGRITSARVHVDDTREGRLAHHYPLSCTLSGD